MENLADGLEASIQGEADQIAKKSNSNDFDDCVTIVAAGLAATGAAKGGPWGAAIGAGAGVPAARIACRRLFPN